MSAIRLPTMGALSGLPDTHRLARGILIACRQSLGVWVYPETPNAKSDRQQGLIPILRNLNLTSDIAERKVYIQHVLTHKEYDRGTWKDD
jgi:hypothetical protein